MKTTIQIVFLFLCLLTVSSLRAQETGGGLEGKITGPDNEPLSRATITAIHIPSGTRYVISSLPDGHYRLPGMRIGGPYSVEVTYTGMQANKKEGIQITLGELQTLHFTLATTSQQLSEVVVAAQRTVKANAFGTGRNINRDQIANLPAINRSIQEITRIVPQASASNSFGGSNFRYNNVTIDGSINNDAIGFSPSLGGITGSSGMPGSSTRTNPISLDAIQDMQVYLAPYDVKIGNFTGGSINAVTRSGTNRVQGSIYAYGRNATITGKNNAGDGKKLPNDFYEYQTGFRVGFPIVKNKVFFFTNMEITRRQDPIQLEAGSNEVKNILSTADAQTIYDTIKNRYGFDIGTYGQYNIYARSNKLFNRIDINLGDQHQLALRNNTIFSEATHLERDQQNFRFGGIAFVQNNNQSSTVAELKSRFNSRLSNNLVAGYTFIHDYRTPVANPAFPQVQIVGRTPGTTIFLGTDREASIFDMKQQTVEITDNLSWTVGKHHLLVGTHNEFYKITYGFVNAWNGRVDYAGIGDFLQNRPSRVRGSYNYTNNDRDYILNHPGAVFNIDFLSAYIQDEIQVNSRLKLLPGIRFDYTLLPQAQPLSTKTQNAFTDVYYGSTFFYTPLNKITNNYLNRIQASPRLGFSYDILSDKSLVVRGGAGLFTGRIPFAWLGYAFYNTGDTYGAYDQRVDNGTSQFQAGSDPMRFNKEGISAFAKQNAQIIDNPNAGRTQVDVVDNNFIMPQVFRSSLALDYTDKNGFKASVEGIITKVIKDVKFQQINIKDDPTYYVYDTLRTLRRQPVYPSGGVNPQFTNAYEMSNTTQGYRYSITGSINKRFKKGITASVAYTYGMAQDITNGVRNSMESNWQLNQALNPNEPGLTYSNFDIRHRIVSNVMYQTAWHDNWLTTFSLFFHAQSGSPYTYGFVNYTAQSTPQQISLAYIPFESEAVNFFQSYTDGGGNLISASQQAQQFNDFINNDSYLRTRRGDYTERNAARTPWNVQCDLHLGQDFVIGKKEHVLSVTCDIINFTNLLNKNWGWVYFSPNTYNSTASVGLLPYLPGKSSQGYPLYQFLDPGKPYSIDFFSSRWQMQLGLRYSF